MTVAEGHSAPPVVRLQQPEAAAPECVCVAVNVRPLISEEVLEGAQHTLFVTPGEPQVGSGPHLFTFDHVFGEGGKAARTLYETCVAPLVEGLFKGYNATVFAYGQTGSGKTYTMGSAFGRGADEEGGVIPRVMAAIFQRINAAPKDIEFAVRVGFVEIHKEEIHDLLCTGRGPHPAVQIREVSGSVCLAGAKEQEVRSQQEMVNVLEQGTLLRATAATNMNKQSSRSHAIFTITLEQRKMLLDGTAAASRRRSSTGEEDSGEDEEGDGGAEGDETYLCAKMHLVDLAGSERAKRTKAVGARLAEGININKGLLALGNVINALSEGKQHVPYRDSKLTRMLQDSLGGNSRTVMIACVSPADVNLEETMNTLRYANRARNIRNKPVVNRDPVAAQIAQLRQQLAAARGENQILKSKLGLGDNAVIEESNPRDDALRARMEELEARNRALEAENERLKVEVGSAQDDSREATDKMLLAQGQRDRLLQQLQQRLGPDAAAEAAAEVEAFAAGGPGSIAGGSRAGSVNGDVIQCQLERIADLEKEIKRLKKVSRLTGKFVVSNRRMSMGGAGGDESSPFSFSPLRPEDRDGSGNWDEISELELNDEEFAAQEQAHVMQNAKLMGEMDRLQKELDMKQATMQSMNRHMAQKEELEKDLAALQQQRDELERERRDLQFKLERLQMQQHQSEDERLRLKAQYENRMRQLDEKFKAVKAKERRILELERTKQKAEGACKKLESDILSIKQQKVALQRQMERGHKEFAEFRRQRDQELLQLKKQGRSNAAQLQRLEALHNKQQAVLRRKTEEAEAARKRLKELEDRQRASASAASLASANSVAPLPTPVPGLDRPATAPAASANAPVIIVRAALSNGIPTATDRSQSSAALTAADYECQPNPSAPLLRDEKSRREWVEGELDAYCSSFELQKMAEGERAQRKEVQRKLREVEKALAALKNPEWWPGHYVHSSPNATSEEKLEARRAQLMQQSEEHSKQLAATLAKLQASRETEEARSNVAADARRWNGVRTVVQARALLKTMFHTASQYKEQAVEAQSQVTELSDEIELLKLRLDIAEQEKCDAAHRAGEAHALLAAASQTLERHSRRQSAASADSAATTPVKPLQKTPRKRASRGTPDKGLMEAREILQQLDELTNDEAMPGSGDHAADAQANGDVSALEASDSEEEQEVEDYWDDEEENEEQEESEEDESEDEERHTLWDPSQATPARGSKPKKAAAEAKPQPPQLPRHPSTTSMSGGSSAVLLPEEQPVLNHLNDILRRQGKEPVSKPTISLMRQVLQDRMINGQRWRLGSKKREDLVRDYRAMLGLRPDVDAPQQAAPSSARGGTGGESGSGTARSRILEHTASSRARRHATVQQSGSAAQPHQSSAASAAGSAAPPPAASGGVKGFGSPLQPQRSRFSSSQEQADAGSTPLGAEGVTPEAAALESRGCETPRVLDPSPAAAPGAGGSGGSGEESRRRDLHLGDLQRQLDSLQLGLTSTTGMAPGAAGSRSRDARQIPAGTAAAASAVGGSGSAGVAGGSLVSPGRRSESPLGRLAGWARRSSRSPPRDRTPPAATAGAQSGAGSGASRKAGRPALAAYEQRADQAAASAAYAMQQIDDELQWGAAGRAGAAAANGDGGSRLRYPSPRPPTGAGRGIIGGSLKLQQQAGKQQYVGSSETEATTYDLEGPGGEKAAQPLRSLNGHGGTSEGGEGGSRTSSPRDGDFRSAVAPENRSRPSSVAATSPRPQPRQQLVTRPRTVPGSSGGGLSSVPVPSRPSSNHNSNQSSPRKQAWKPL